MHHSRCSVPGRTHAHTIAHETLHGVERDGAKQALGLQAKKARRLSRTLLRGGCDDQMILQLHRSGTRTPDLVPTVLAALSPALRVSPQTSEPVYAGTELLASVSFLARTMSSPDDNASPAAAGIEEAKAAPQEPLAPESIAELPDDAVGQLEST